MRPWITDSALTETGDLEVLVQYPDGKQAWLNVPGEVAGTLDLISLAEVAERRPPPTLARGRGQVSEQDPDGG